jgi:hypothetical protein
LCRLTRRFRPNPSRRTIALIGIPSARCNRRISASPPRSTPSRSWKEGPDSPAARGSVSGVGDTSDVAAPLAIQRAGRRSLAHVQSAFSRMAATAVAGSLRQACDAADHLQLANCGRSRPGRTHRPGPAAKTVTSTVLLCAPGRARWRYGIGTDTRDCTRTSITWSLSSKTLRWWAGNTGGSAGEWPAQPRRIVTIFRRTPWLAGRRPPPGQPGAPTSPHIPRA